MAENGTELCSKRLQNAFKLCGVIQETNALYVLKQNGLAKRMSLRLFCKAK